ncbi:MAG: DUF3048 domain-containing protein [bacterium]|nr:DUF3048 domain-containing protein [bacterium]MCM1374525.1 DUF3048 domain-containing protein [Muribaculum sp.]
MKKIKFLTVALLTACVLAGCGNEEEPVGGPISPDPIPIETEKPATPDDTQGADATDEPEGPMASTDTIGTRTVVDGKMQSYLTGEWKDEAVARRRSMAVMIPNNKPSLPQYGISRASIIYEAPVEGRITRLMAFFEDYDDLDHIGPVRSSRDYYVYEAMGLDAIYCNWGLAIPFVEALLAGDDVDNISQAVAGIHNPSSEAFERIDRGSGYKTEYTGYMFIDGYNKAVERQGYDKEYDSDFRGAFLFANDGHRAEYANMPDATKVYPGGTNSNSSGYGNARPVFEYNAEEGIYYRYQYNEKQIDEMNGEQLTVSNIVFKVCEGSVREPVANDYMFFETHGRNDAYVFTNGKVIKGTWAKDDIHKPARFYDENGNEIVLNQGKTWICNIWEDYVDCIDWE